MRPRKLFELQTLKQKIGIYKHGKGHTKWGKLKIHYCIRVQQRQKGSNRGYNDPNQERFEPKHMSTTQ